METINREQFEAWLLAQPRERPYKYVQGAPTDYPGCIACNFIREMTNVNADISPREMRIDKRAMPLPTWFIKLISKVQYNKYFHRKPETFGLVQDHYLKLFGDSVFTDKATDFALKETRSVLNNSTSPSSDVNAIQSK